jgi:hypothetical protein
MFQKQLLMGRSIWLLEKIYICERAHDVATLALGSRPRQGATRLRAKWETREHSTCSRECKECEGMSPHTPKWTPMLGVGVPKGLSKLQSAIARVKSPCLEEFFISLERSSSVNVQNGLAWAIWTSEAQVMGKRRLGVKLRVWEKKTPDQKKSGIDPIYLATGNMRHIVGKLSTKATTLLQTASRLEVCRRSYAPSKSRESLLAGFQDSHVRVLGEKSHLDAGPVESHRVYYKGEGGGFPQVRAVVSLVCPCCPWLVLAPKVLQLCINHFVWVVCRPVWVNKLVNSS